MQICILCGGSGTRLKEQTEFIPKPMIPIGGRPMLYHIMKLYSHYGFNEFVLALGYKQEIIKDYFVHLDIINNDITVDIGQYRGANHHGYADKGWRVTLSDTGENTMKGGRLKRIEKYIRGNTFMMTYGDGIGNINIPELLEFHQKHGRIATVTGIHPLPRFGEIHRQGERVLNFTEKPNDPDCLMNGGFFVFNREIFDYLHPDEWCDLEVGPLEMVANDGELMVYHHTGYWGCMDNLKDMSELQKLWNDGKAPWKVWP